MTQPGDTNVPAEGAPEVPAGHPGAALYKPEEHPIADLPAAGAPTRTVVIPVDRSQHSAHTVAWARHHVLRDTDMVVLVNVRPYPQMTLLDISGEVLSAMETLEGSARHESHELIREYGRMLTAPGPGASIQYIKGFAIRGDARADILRKARELHADLIVMGSRGLGAIRRTLLGSVSDYIVHHARCPVIIVKEPEPVQVEAAPSIVAPLASGALKTVGTDVPPAMAQSL